MPFSLNETGPCIIRKVPLHKDITMWINNYVTSFFHLQWCHWSWSLAHVWKSHLIAHYCCRRNVLGGMCHCCWDPLHSAPWHSDLISAQVLQWNKTLNLTVTVNNQHRLHTSTHIRTWTQVSTNTQAVGTNRELNRGRWKGGAYLWEQLTRGKNIM